MSSFAGGGVQMSFTDYAAQKTAGTAQVIKLNGVPHAAIRRYDPVTGAPAPQLVQLNAEILQKQKEQLESDLAAATQLIADVAAAREVVPDVQAQVVG